MGETENENTVGDHRKETGSTVKIIIIIHNRLLSQDNLL